MIQFNNDTIDQLIKQFEDKEVIVSEKVKNIIYDNRCQYYIQDLVANLDKALVRQGYSPQTVFVYKAQIRRFLNYVFNLFQNNNFSRRFILKDVFEFLKNEIDSIINEQTINKYIFKLIRNEEHSHSYTNQFISAINFFSREVLHNNELVINLIRPPKNRKLPVILSQQEVYKILNCLTNLKHRALLFLTYSAGLRVSEVVKLKVADIDRERMLIHIKQGKGSKDRYSLLSRVALKELNKYVNNNKLNKWLFSGAKKGKHITIRSAQKIFKNACKKVKIKKDVSIHSLRHSFSTHLLEKGTDLRYIQELLGHKSSRTTEIYTHVSKKDIMNIISPLDNIKN
ncbi:MAG: tyrosine-type recombinase/integrase [bacterium]